MVTIQGSVLYVKSKDGRLNVSLRLFIFVELNFHFISTDKIVLFYVNVKQHNIFLKVYTYLNRILFMSFSQAADGSPVE